MKATAEQTTWLARFTVGLEVATGKRWEAGYACDSHGEVMTHLAELRLPSWPGSVRLRSHELTYRVVVYFHVSHGTARVVCPGVDCTSRVAASPTVAVRRVAAGLPAAVRAWDAAIMDDRAARARSARTAQYARELAALLGGEARAQRSYTGEGWVVVGGPICLDVYDGDTVHLRHGSISRDEARAIAEAFAALRAAEGVVAA